MDEILNPFQREELETYQKFIEEAKSYFPNHIGLKRLDVKVVNFTLLLATIFEARKNYPGFQEESLLLCQQIAKFATRNIDSKDREMFQSQLLYECEIVYKDIIERYIKITDSLDYIDQTTQDIAESFFIDEVRSFFAYEPWSQYAMDLDRDVLIALIMQTDAYKGHQEYALSLVYDIAEYECNHIQEDERTMFIEQYLYEIKHAEKDLLSKYALLQNIPLEPNMVESQGRTLFEKEILIDQEIIVQSSKKSAKNKRQKSAEKQVSDLIQKGKSFEIISKPTNIKNGIKRIVVRLSFEALIGYVKTILPSNAIIDDNGNSIKVFFGKTKSKYCETDKKRILLSRQ